MAIYWDTFDNNSGFLSYNSLEEMVEVFSNLVCDNNGMNESGRKKERKRKRKRESNKEKEKEFPVIV